MKLLTFNMQNISTLKNLLRVHLTAQAYLEVIYFDRKDLLRWGSSTVSFYKEIKGVFDLIWQKIKNPLN